MSRILSKSNRKRKLIAKQRAHRIKQRQRERGMEQARASKFEQPVLSTTQTRYEVSDRVSGTAYGGIALAHRLAVDIGLVDAINRKLHVLKTHVPYHESDHVLNFAFNAMCDGRCIEDIECRRQDEAYLDALGVSSVPDPTTAGDFTRRFDEHHIWCLHDACDEGRLNVWSEQPEDFFEEAVIDMDGTYVITDAECKQGVDMCYKGNWAYHPLVTTLANTNEVLSIVNRPGNRPSEEGAYLQADRAIALCRRGGFKSIRLRGDTAFKQTTHLDRWHGQGVVFQFGYDARSNLVKFADELDESKWTQLNRPKKYEVKTSTRRRPENVKPTIVRARGYLNQRLNSEQVAEFDYSPTA